MRRRDFITALGSMAAGSGPLVAPGSAWLKRGANVLNGLNAKAQSSGQ
jgi:hypothetical protein